jgi:hypothetical protein
VKIPLTIQISSEKEHGRQHFIEVIEDTRVKTSGRPGTRPLEVLEDAAYDYVDIRKYLMFRVLG